MLLTAGERIAMSLVAIAVNARGCRAAPTPAAGRHHHRHAARQGQDRRDPPAEDQGVARRGQRRDPRGLPGPVDRVRHHDARPRRLGHTAVAMAAALGQTSARSTPTSTACSRPTLGPTPRPARSTGSPTRRCSSRRRGREGPPAPVRGVRSTARCPHPRSELPRRATGNVGRRCRERRESLRGARHARERPDPRGRPGRRGGQGHPRRGARSPRHRRVDLQGRGRRGDPCRHDRAEHLARRADRPELHDPPCRRAPRERRARASWPTSAPCGSRPTTRPPLSLGAGIKSNPAWPPTCSTRWPPRASTSR